MKDLKGKKVAVLGFGIEGVSVVDFLLTQMAHVSVFDEKEEKKFDTKKIKQYKDKGVEFSFLSIPHLLDFDMIVRSPGISLMNLEIENAQKKGILITSSTKLFFDFCPGKIIGVTGTKGKGTTSSLIFEMLKKQGYDAYLGGNIGTPPLTFLDSVTEASWVVLELSSFQLQDLDKSPHIAVMLMVTSEHLDYHKDIHEYIAAKRNIVAHQTDKDFTILNRDYPASHESDILTEGNVFLVSREREVVEGCFVKDGSVWIRKDDHEDEIIHVKDILLPGKHNFENVCAAAMASFLAGVNHTHIAEVLKTFKGLEHRLELIATIQGVRYYDDSFSTTPETAEAAIEAFQDPEILILGGSSKNSDFARLGELISAKENIKAIIGIGKEWERIKKTIHTKQIILIEGAKNMHDIVLAASKIATLGDIVLLSPACASFDMFKNYKYRGDEFKKEVIALKALESN